MRLVRFVHSLLTRLGLQQPATPIVTGSDSIYAGESARPVTVSEQPPTIVNLWDYLAFKENTQAQHIVAVLGFEEWIPMEELCRRIIEVFAVEYENDRSLYPYVKTLVDAGLLETIRTERKQKWRKRALFFRLLKKRQDREETETILLEARPTPVKAMP
ncbi:MAG TPA: hypothetical protein HA252_00580 [Candidatus Diapherotrites archaeon]|uniref:Uncharacterized protein n=1 Tax=Candidatus Iainarchaeum sp. TaxID=3101447 RepID=A0A7J4JEZ7_9ARCH|nr:hypothetical protein [Candidatus Diapherotrites archaeon]HIH15884.1 hypothetical protein [Candidatus Diapherotrites archaeon]